jgi:hypothetical protein
MQVALNADSRHFSREYVPIVCPVKKDQGRCHLFFGAAKMEGESSRKFPETAMAWQSCSGFFSRRHSALRNSDQFGVTELKVIARP